MGVALVIIGIACILYGVAVMLVGSGTWFFAFWYVLGALVLAAAWFVMAGKWAALPDMARHVVCGVIAVLLAGFAFTQVLILKDFGGGGEPRLDFIVVLGAQVYEDRPSVVLQYRLDAARDYLKANPSTKCIVSGGQGPNEHTAEANVMADYLVQQGIDPARIIREDASENTKENIANSREIIGSPDASVGIVTNNFHQFRSLALARKQGMTRVCGIAAGSVPLYLPNNMVRESLGIAKDFLAGNM